uniref:Aquaporin n=1 Tax=Ascaris lumbricoides TaxID=6252 RepID=A0A0M3HRD5_ASCLU
MELSACGSIMLMQQRGTDHNCPCIDMDQLTDVAFVSMLRTDIDIGPIFIATSFYLTVFVIAELTRKIVDRYVAYNTLLYYFLIEAVATSQMCTCVYENAVIIRHYGPIGFFFAVTSVLFAGGFTNRGAFISPLKPIEMFYYGSIRVPLNVSARIEARAYGRVQPHHSALCKADLQTRTKGFRFDRLLSVVAGEALGGYSAYRVARQLWYWSLSIAADHAINYESTRCAFAYKVPFPYAFTFEIFGAFLLRSILTRLPKSSVRYATPAVISAFLTFSLAYIGVSGLNPTVASSRMQGCDGLSTQWFILTYWVCPTVGWMLSAIVDNKWRALISKKKE